MLLKFIVLHSNIVLMLINLTLFCSNFITAAKCLSNEMIAAKHLVSDHHEQYQ